MAADQTALPISTPGSLTSFRYCSYDVPFWARDNTRPGRWHRVGDGPTQYWSLCPEAAWAELIRAEHLESEEELDLLRMPLWVCRVPMVGIIDLRDPQMQEQYEIAAVDILNEDWTACQRAASVVRRDARGILAESAALPGHTNMTLFGARRAVDWHTRPALASTLATTQAAIGRPPIGLVDRVRRVGPASHAPQLF